MMVEQRYCVADYDRVGLVPLRRSGESRLPEPAYSVQPVEGVFVHRVITGLETLATILMIHDPFPGARQDIVVAESKLGYSYSQKAAKWVLGGDRPLCGRPSADKRDAALHRREVSSRCKRVVANPPEITKGDEPVAPIP